MFRISSYAWDFNEFAETKDLSSRSSRQPPRFTNVTQGGAPDPTPVTLMIQGPGRGKESLQRASSAMVNSDCWYWIFLDICTYIHRFWPKVRYISWYIDINSMFLILWDPTSLNNTLPLGCPSHQAIQITSFQFSMVNKRCILIEYVFCNTTRCWPAWLFFQRWISDLRSGQTPADAPTLATGRSHHAGQAWFCLGKPPELVDTLPPIIMVQWKNRCIST